jgi:4-hydroxy-tetrahydrodipicolinate synthase
MTAYAGVFHVLVTPFDEDGRVDVAALRGLVAFAIDHGVAGLTALGVNGEAHSLDDDERELVAAAVLQAGDGAVPVVLGASAPDPGSPRAVPPTPSAGEPTPRWSPARRRPRTSTSTSPP